MNEDPLIVHRHITLTVEKPLEKRVIKSWLDCVKRAAPNGVVATLQTTDEDGAPRAVKLVHRAVKDKNLYLVPLSRDLLPDEVERIVEVFMLENPEQDFDIETHANFMAALDRPSANMDHDKHLALSAALSKAKHDDWMKTKIDAGWRYGPELSMENKTHPLLLPWEQLPEKYKTPDLEWPEKLISILGDQGYSVIAKDNLEKMLSVLKKVV
jgi:hypothetical protein